MAIDLSQFHQVFFEESIEGLDIMESSLMELDPSDVDDETINTIFRSAHSIKGGSGTFNFTAIGEFTHVLETLLDQVRAGKRQLQAAHVELLLQSVDCLREMLDLAQSGDLDKPDQAANLQGEFEKILAIPCGEESAASTDDRDNNSSEHQRVEPSPDEDVQSWAVLFRPHEDMLRTGNDPVRLLRELRALDAFNISCGSDDIPDFDSLDPEISYLSWTLELDSQVPREAIDEIFEWVSDSADINIEKSKKTNAWRINFAPNEDINRSGNNPAKIIEELAALSSTITVHCDSEKLPSFDDLDPESNYLKWNIDLESTADIGKLNQAFEWVVDDSDLSITPRPTDSDAQVQSDGAQNIKVQGVRYDSGNAQSEKSESAVAESHENPPEVKAKKATPKKASSEATSIRVGIDKIDNLINMVGELVITQSMLGQLSDEVDVSRVPRLVEGLSQLEQNTRELQEGVMRIRMLPISFSFNRFPRLVRDLGQRLNKKVNLEVSGEQTELDKTVMEKIGDPLVHLVRNAIDHGIESPEERAKCGKDETGTIALDAYHKGGNIVIEIKDDGAGLDREKLIEKAVDKGITTKHEASMMSDEHVFDLIFQPGFSTAAAVTDVSGRGVGMDVVKRNIQALNGGVEISSKKGVGSTIAIRLPLTLAILDGQLIRVGENIYIFPLVSIVESMQCRADLVNTLAGGQQVFRLRDEYVPIIELSKTFSVKSDTESIEGALMVVVESDGQKVGVVVDELLAQQQVVIKSLEQNYKQVDGVSGATILGDGTVALILDVPSIVQLFSQKMAIAQQLGVSHSENVSGLRPYQ